MQMKPMKVYTIIDRGHGKKSFWNAIGIAYRNKDNSINVVLNALPTNGTLNIRDDDDEEDISSD